MSGWALKEAEESCNTVFERAWGGEPQLIMRDHEPSLVVITYKEYVSQRPQKPTLFETLRSCPYGDLELKVERNHEDYGRKVSFD